MLLKAYFDDAGTHKRSEVKGLGGLIGTEDAWTALEDDWGPVIDDYRPYGLTAFHAYDCEVGDGDFQNIQRPIREAISRKFARIIRTHKQLRPIWSAVVQEAWDQEADSDFIDRYKTPFGLCFEWCIQQASNWSTQYAGGSPIALVFSEQNDFADRMNEVFGYYLGAKRYAPLRTLTFGSYRDLRPLQAADQLATEVFRYWRSAELDGTAFRVRQEIVELEKDRGMALGGCYDVIGLKSAVSEYRKGLSSGQPS